MARILTHRLPLLGKRPLLLVAVLLPCPAATQSGATAGAATEEHRVSGREAWDVARRAGFEFGPVGLDERYIVSGPRDGVRTTLKFCDDATRPCRTVARVVEGNPQVDAPTCAAVPCARGYRFALFAGKRLAAGWSFARVEIDGNGWSWDRQPRSGSRDPGFVLQVEARSGAAGSARIRTLVLHGPPGAAWPQAFRVR